MPMRAEGRNRRNRMVSGMCPPLCASISAWSKAMLARPPRIPVSITRNGFAAPHAMATCLDLLRESAAELGSNLVDVATPELERIGGDVSGGRIAVGTIASGDVRRDLARTARGAKGDAGIDDRIELVLRQAKIDEPPGRVETHARDVMAAIVDQITAQLNSAPLRARALREALHECPNP